MSESEGRLIDAAKEIAAILGDGWTVERYIQPGCRPDTWRVKLRKGEIGVFMEEDYRGKRVTVRGIWPWVNGREFVPMSEPTIGMGYKSPQAMAADILRRFLPRYVEEFTRQQEYARRYRESHDLCASIAKRLAQLGRGLGKDSEVRVQNDYADVWIDALHIIVHPGGVVQFTLKCDDGKAASVIRTYFG